MPEVAAAAGGAESTEAPSAKKPSWREKKRLKAQRDKAYAEACAEAEAAGLPKPPPPKLGRTGSSAAHR